MGGFVHTKTDEQHPSSTPGRFRETVLDYADAFSCVAYLDGEIDISPEDLREAFAVAYEDSIYVSMKVMLDETVPIWTCATDYFLPALLRPFRDAQGV
jgi:hypothetical protein